MGIKVRTVHATKTSDGKDHIKVCLAEAPDGTEFVSIAIASSLGVMSDHEVMDFICALLDAMKTAKREGE